MTVFGTRFGRMRKGVSVSTPASGSPNSQECYSLLQLYRLREESVLYGVNPIRVRVADYFVASLAQADFEK